MIAALVEGVSVNAAVRMTGESKPTILKLLRDSGPAVASGLTDQVWTLDGLIGLLD